jgi:uncharacterized protein (TIGR00299 family) protein
MTGLKRGDGAGRILFFDCFSGLSGDMIVAALIDLGVPFARLEEAAAMLPIGGYRLRHEREMRGPFKVSRFHVDMDIHHSDHHRHRRFADIRQLILDSKLPPGAADRSVRIFETLAQAEATVHGTAVDDVHFHEVGAVDSIVDIVCAAAAIDYLACDVACGPVPLGCGFIETQHGRMPLPAPATLHILKGVPVEGTPVRAELTTPTGAAIVRTLASGFGPIPAMTPSAIGFGAGTRALPDAPGILRVVLGTPDTSLRSPASHVVIEANIDDMTGELAAHAMETILNAGALDVWCETIQMKKGRPALKICILAAGSDLLRMGGMLLSQTSTIGLRWYGVNRMEMTRSVSQVDTPFGPVRVKRAVWPGGASNHAVEFADCRRLAAETGVPLKEIYAVAQGLAQPCGADEQRREKP